MVYIALCRAIRRVYKTSCGQSGEKRGDVARYVATRILPNHLRAMGKPTQLRV